MEKEIYLAAGCFWGAEHYLKQLDGVVFTETGYANGHTQHPSYEEVYTDTTGFAETVHVRYNPQRISLKYLLEMYFRSIDPTSLNRQGADEGTRYRTGIYYTDADDRPMAEYVMEQEAKRCSAPLQVELLPLSSFYRAEEYHQDYLTHTPGGYCHLPKSLFEEARRQRDTDTIQKNDRYAMVSRQMQALVGDESDEVALMANMVALLHGSLGHWWTGFYRVLGDQLVLGPFQGPLACMRIAFGRGVCGTAWQRQRTVVVPDVERFEGHIACSSESRSEIVVPVWREGSIVAVLDIDSRRPAAFDDCDRYWLEQIVG